VNKEKLATSKGKRYGDIRKWSGLSQEVGFLRAILKAYTYHSLLLK